jgi:hypothetical protein
MKTFLWKRSKDKLPPRAAIFVNIGNPRVFKPGTDSSLPAPQEFRFFYPDLPAIHI